LLIFENFHFLLFWYLKLIIQNDHADLATMIIIVLRRYHRHGEKPFSPTIQILEVAEMLTKIEHNLERLTLDILNATIDDFPLHYDRHTVGVLGPISHLLQ